jgi:release factor glutamine methyltransferase
MKDMIRKFFNKIRAPFLRIFAKHYFAKPRKYNYKSIHSIILPGVFHPHFTISTKLLLRFIENFELHGKTFLELGCGSGIISILAANKGAKVSASDINPNAIENAILNAKRNKVEISTFLSDLFKDIPEQVFDFIVINPPYYPKKPSNMAEQAWFCGDHYEYFENLFSTLTNYFDKKSTVIIILSEDCAIEHIKRIAEKTS